MLSSVIALAVVAIPVASGFAQGPSNVPAADPYAEVVPGTGASAGSAPRVVPERGDGTAAMPLLERAKGNKGGGKGRSRRLLTGFGDYLFTSGDDAVRQRLFDETVGMNGSVVRLLVDWRAVAPGSLSASFDPTDPASPQYDWGYVDAMVRDSVERGLRPLLLVTSAPDWAEGPNRPADAPTGTWKPDPGAIADFAEAIAKRYSGGFQGLPRVRDYMLWNEPNLPSNLTPQWNKSGRKPVVAYHYRDMLNAFYNAVHGVARNNIVFTGGTAPYGSPPGPYAVQVRPLFFWREVMCVKGVRRPHASKCKKKPKFDVLAHHPIDTSGGPTTSAISPDDVSTPDLHNLVDVLRVAERGHNIGTSGKHPVWATELWWESSPPDKKDKAIPNLATQAKWYEQALYLLWKQGASTVLFYQVRDDPYSGPPGRGFGSSFDTGVYFSDDTPKPSAQAVRFPFVGERSKKKEVTIWGIAPASGKLTVTQQGKGPKKVTTLKVRSGRIFTKQVRLKGKGKHRIQAKVAGEKSLKYPVK